VLALVGVDYLPCGLVVEDRVAVVHRGAGLHVVEVPRGVDLLTEVLHEPVGARVQRRADPSLATS
jgi:hypothetical protein